MIKAIAFDFDDTLYIGNVWGNYYNYIKDSLTKYFNSKEEAEELLTSHGYDNKVNLDDVVWILVERNKDIKKLMDIVSSDIYKHATRYVKVISSNFLLELSKKYHLYITSFSNPNYLKFYIKEYKLPNCFEECLSVDILGKDKNKIPLYRYIIEKENIKPSEFLVVGDNFKRDIVTAQNLGAETFYFNSQENFNEIYDYFTKNNILNCDKFKTKN